ncbi:MAG: TonB-dependent receptor [Bacteroidota bacterium]
MKKDLLKYSLALVAFFLLKSSAIAQEKGDTTKAKQQPLELPEFVITGQEQLNVPGGIKQEPLKTRALKKSELDSLNSLEKQTTLVPSPVVMPSTAFQANPFKGFVRGEFGQFITPDILGGYSADFEGYNVFANGRFTTSGGHVDNADFTKIFGSANLSYTAPEKYYIFGGSTTETSVLFKRDSYKLYAISAAPQRSTTEFGARVDVDGNFEGFSFSSGAGYDMLNLSHESRETTDNNLNGFLKLQNMWRGFLVGGDVLLDFHTLRGDGLRFVEFAGNGEFSNDVLTLRGRGGFQTAKGNFAARNALLLDGEVEFRFSELFTIRGGASTGLKNNTFKKLIEINPYLADSAQVDFAYNPVMARAFLIIHPTPEMSFSAGVRSGLTDRLPFFKTAADSGSFAVMYEDASILEIIGEAFWQITPRDNFAGNVTVTGSSFRSEAFKGKSIPYVAPLQGQFMFNHAWTDEFSTGITAAFTGERTADLESTTKLPAYTDLRLEGNYKLNERFSVFARANNLLNQDIYVWQNYRERGIFGAAGVLWKF